MNEREMEGVRENSNLWITVHVMICYLKLSFRSGLGFFFKKAT